MAERDPRPNLICIVSDTLRTADMGCYGSREVHTPNLDAFAADSAVFDAAYPESLPTVPVRRALHTGRRAYPFRDYRPLKWDIVYLPGWQAIDNNEDTLAENLAEAGYHTGFVTDTLPYFQPGLNFTRGFWQWEFIRGQQQDRWKSPATVTDDQMRKYGDPAELRQHLERGIVPRHVANTAHVHHEEDTNTARTFRWAMDFVEDNRSLQPFYLLVDCFDPHEPWDAPDHYLAMYADPAYRGRTIAHAQYRPMEEQMTLEELRFTHAHYRGLVSLVDTWFGRLIDQVRRCGLMDNTVIVFLSDHGTNFGDTPEHVVGKPGTALYPGVMHLPLMVRFPDGAGRGQRFPQLVYNIDATATLYDAAGLTSADGIDGHGLRPIVDASGWEPRAYLTSRYGDTCWYRDATHWVILTIDGEALGVFDLTRAPGCMDNIVDRSPDVVRMAWERVLADAGGALPDYRDAPRRTDAIGR